MTESSTEPTDAAPSASEETSAAAVDATATPEDAAAPVPSETAAEPAAENAGPEAEATPAADPDAPGAAIPDVDYFNITDPLEKLVAKKKAEKAAAAAAAAAEEAGEETGEEAEAEPAAAAERAEPEAPTEDEIARVRELFERAETADGQLSGFHFARWDRPLCPAVFGADEAGADALVSGLKDAARLVGLEVVDEDPDLGANILYFLCSEWSELRTVPALDRLIPDLDKLCVLLAAAGANQYRIFSFSPDGGLRLSVILIRYDEDLGKMSPQALALGQAVQALLLWSDQAFVRDNPVDAGWRRGRSSRDRRPRVTRWFTALLRAAYAEGSPAYSADPALAETLATAVARDLERPSGSKSRGRGSRAQETTEDAADANADTVAETADADDPNAGVRADEIGADEADAPEADAPETEAAEAEAAETETAETPTERPPGEAAEAEPSAEASESASESAADALPAAQEPASEDAAAQEAAPQDPTSEDAASEAASEETATPSPSSEEPAAEAAPTVTVRNAPTSEAG